jgi:alpha-1,6-mannosyltransferase
VLILTITGLLVEICLVGMVFLHDLRQHTIPFLGLYGLACLGYGTAVYWLLRRPHRSEPRPRGSASGETSYILSLAILFRVTLLFTTPPTLSDDVYRYIWDGRLTNAGVNPYAYAVESPLLDRFDHHCCGAGRSQRALVNNSWMASPYLPAAQALFAAVYRLAPDSPLAFQVTAGLFDLLTGWLVTDLLLQLGLPRARALIYLWNPLVVVEFAHGAHVDALMICLMMAALWSLVVARRRETPPTSFSVVALAAATLTKGLPALLLPVVARRWGWRRTIVYAGLIIAVCLPFALGAGWGLTGPLDGEGLFGALRIYAARWNYNGGIYHWLEVGLSGYWTPGAVPPEVVGWGPIRAARLIVAVTLGLVLIAVWRMSQRCDGDLALLRLAAVPLAAYLLLTTTVHPWYVTLIVPLLPFLLPKKGESATIAPQAARTGVGRRLLLPWLFFSASVSLSYLTYLDPANLREYDLVRLVEYVPLYLLLVWSAWPASGGVDGPGAD